MLRYGTDRPDRRVGHEIVELTEAFRGSEFKVFASVIESGGVVRGLKASGEFPRSRFDALTEQAQSLGAGGLVWGVVEEGGALRSPVAKFLSEDEIGRALDALGAAEGDVVLIVADRAEVAAKVLGALRLEVAGPGARGRARRAVGGRLPDVRVGRRGRALRPAAPSLHGAHRRPRRRPGHVAQPRLRRGARRLGAGRGLHPHQHARRAAEGLRRAGHRPGRGAASASASCSRRCATERRRTAASPSGSTGS